MTLSTIPSYAYLPLEGLTHEAVRGLSLYAMLLRITKRGPSRLSRDIFRSHPDPRRLFSAKQRRLILQRDGHICCYCKAHVTGNEGDRVYIDHVIPWVLGGQTVVDNGVVSCSCCNSKKGAKVW